MLRQGTLEPLNFTITREIIDIPILQTEVVNETIGVLRLFNFSINSHELVRGALTELLEEGSTTIILDLRNNPGGFLDQSIDIASEFLAQGKIVLRERGSDRDIKYASKGYLTIDPDMPVVVLVNGGSASASEIVAGALQEHERAILVGTQTFGKGTVQELLDVGRASSVKITVAEWLTPQGNTIRDTGLSPDIEVPLGNIHNLEEGEIFVDAQMQKAIEILSSQ